MTILYFNTILYYHIYIYILLVKNVRIIIRFRHNTFYTIIILYVIYVSTRSVIILLVFFIVHFFFVKTRMHAIITCETRQHCCLSRHIHIIKYNIFMYTHILLCARAHACVYVCVNACVCSRRQDSGGAANVGALCRLVNARRDVTSHARLTKWTSFAKSAPPPPKYIFPRPFRAAFTCRRIFVFFFFNSPLYQFHSTCSKLLLCSGIMFIIIIIINTSIKMSQSQFVFIILL